MRYHAHGQAGSICKPPALRPAGADQGNLQRTIAIQSGRHVDYARVILPGGRLQEFRASDLLVHWDLIQLRAEKAKIRLHV